MKDYKSLKITTNNIYKILSQIKIIKIRIYKFKAAIYNSKYKKIKCKNDCK